MISAHDVLLPLPFALPLPPPVLLHIAAMCGERSYFDALGITRDMGIQLQLPSCRLRVDPAFAHTLGALFQFRLYADGLRWLVF